jgi:bifunctional DNA-binding transcriptional regulator/antitoxin component of YhaV-PrlF toxin-antitoxin module
MEQFKAIVISGNRVTIPKAVAKALNIKTKDIVTVNILEVQYNRIRL